MPKELLGASIGLMIMVKLKAQNSFISKTHKSNSQHLVEVFSRQHSYNHSFSSFYNCRFDPFYFFMSCHMSLP